MKNFYFTFGNGHEQSGYFQLISASTSAAATKIMHYYYGKNWSCGYTEEDFKEALSEGIFTDLKPLVPLYETITFGDMKILTDRFNQIMGAGQAFKLNRLKKMREDLLNLISDQFVLQIFETVEEEIKLLEMGRIA